jgi:prepilin-type N-terminal cleavage/methylation domain-containing protein
MRALTSTGLHPKCDKDRGFTLLEILIAMAILSFSLVALLGHQGVAIQASDYSNRVSQASFLLEGKLLDVKQKICSDSIDIYDNCDEGDFRDEGFRATSSNSYRWKVCAFKLEIQEGASEQLTERLSSLLMGFMGGGESSSALGSGMGNPLSGAFGGLDPTSGMEKAMGQIAMATGMIPNFLQQLEDQIRKVRIEVSWRDQTQERRLLLERFITPLGASGCGGEGPPAADDLANENKQELEEDMINAGRPPPQVKK